MIHRNKLYTFGCSWVYGIGAGYEEGMSASHYKKIYDNLDFANAFSMRKHLSNHYQLENINNAGGGSSNQLQERTAQNIFLYGDKFENCMVIWGITSVYRGEWFNNRLNTYESVMFSDDLNAMPKHARTYLEDCFDEKEEIKILERKISLWNGWFKSVGIKNYWFNTFNNHLYGIQFDNMLFGGLDLLSKLADNNDRTYHKSRWTDDVDVRAKIGIEKGFLNPISRHPTKLGHEVIADWIIKDISQRGE